MPTISFSNGLASGIDTRAIVDALVAVEGRPILLLEARAARRAAEVAAIEALASLLLSVEIEAERLERGDAFEAFAVRSSDDEVAVGAARAGAAPGAYTLTVGAVARAEVFASQGYASEDAVVGTGSIVIAVGSAPAVTVAIDAEHASLSGLRDAINASDADVTASLVNTGVEGAPVRLLLTAKATGAANTIAVTPALSGGGEPVFETTVAAADAKVTLGSGAVGGSPVTVTSATNAFEGLIEGVTLTVRSASDTPVTIEVAADDAATIAAVRAFVDRANAALGFIAAQSAFDGDRGSRPALLGDAALLRVEAALRRAVSEPVATPGGARSLASAGVTMGADGRLSLDEARFSAALESDRGAVRDLFARFGADLSRALAAFTDAVGGTLAGRERAASRQIEALDEQIERIEARVERRRRLLEARFEAVERAIASLQGQGAFLSAHLAGPSLGASDGRTAR